MQCTSTTYAPRRRSRSRSRRRSRRGGPEPEKLWEGSAAQLRMHAAVDRHVQPSDTEQTTGAGVPAVDAPLQAIGDGVVGMVDDFVLVEPEESGEDDNVEDDFIPIEPDETVAAQDAIDTMAAKDPWLDGRNAPTTARPSWLDDAPWMDEPVEPVEQRQRLPPVPPPLRRTPCPPRHPPAQSHEQSREEQPREEWPYEEWPHEQPQSHDSRRMVYGSRRTPDGHMTVVGVVTRRRTARPPRHPPAQSHEQSREEQPHEEWPHEE